MLDMNIIIDRLIYHEGLKLIPYKCPAGKWTIGVGRCIETNPFTYEELKAIGDSWQKGITKNAAIMLLRNDIEKCLEKLNTWEWYKDLNDERQYALLDMCFQLGFEGLSRFTNMLKFMKMKLYPQASAECLNSKYANQTPKRAHMIAKLIEKSEWQIYL